MADDASNSTVRNVNVNGSWWRRLVVWLGQRTALATLVVLAAAGLVVAGFMWVSDPEPSAAPAAPDGEFVVLAAADGELTVAKTRVAQLEGRCTASGTCEYRRADQGLPAVSVEAGTPSVPVKAGTSTVFSVSVFSTTGVPPNRISLSVADGRLLTGELPVGGYQVSLSGDDGGMWEFTINVTSVS